MQNYIINQHQAKQRLTALKETAPSEPFEILFIKADGTERKMLADFDFPPAPPADPDKPRKERKESADTMAVHEIGNGIRSFCFSRLLSITKGDDTWEIVQE